MHLCNTSQDSCAHVFILDFGHIFLFCVDQEADLPLSLRITIIGTRTIITIFSTNDAANYGLIYHATRTSNNDVITILRRVSKIIITIKTYVHGSWLNPYFSVNIWMMVSVHDSWTLTHWGRVTHICVSDLTSIGSDNGLSPGRRQAIIRTNAGILLIRPLGTNFSEILIEILTFSFKKMRLKVSSAKWRPFCLGLNELTAALTTHKLLNCLVLNAAYPLLW